MKLLEKINDYELTIRVKHGEKDAYNELFQRYAPRIYPFALSYLKSEASAEELVQDVFLKIWEIRDTLDQTKNIKSFIFKIAINTIYDEIRKKNLEYAYQDFVTANADIESNNTWHTIIYDEMLGKMKKLIEQLPEQRRIIFQLSKEEGLSNEEIAKKLNLSKRTVENQLYRAVNYLKKFYQGKSAIALLFFFLYCG